MSAVLEVIADAFVFLGKVVANIICAAFFIASLPAFWRWPWLFQDGMKKCDFDDGEWRLVALANFWCMIFDLITFPIFFVDLCSWRIVNTCVCLSEADDLLTTLNFHELTWKIFWELLLDIPTFIAFILAHIPFWRLPLLYKKLWNTEHKPLIHCSTGSHYNHDNRKVIFRHLTETKMLQGSLNAFVNFLCAIMGLIVVCCILRAKSFIEDVAALLTERGKSTPFADEDLDPKEDDTSEVTASKDRKRSARDDFLDEMRTKLRLTCLKHFLLNFRDLLCIPFAAIVIASLYRGVLFFSFIVRRVSSWAPYAEPVIDVTEMYFEPAPNGRPKGIIWRVKGKKKAEYKFPAGGAQVNMYVRSEDHFWSKVGGQLGNATATVAQMMLPVRLDGDYFDPSAQINSKAGETDVELVFDFNVKFGLQTIRDITKKFPSNSVAFVQAEIGTKDATLFYTGIDLHTIDQYVRTKECLPVDDMASRFRAMGGSDRDKGERFADVFWEVTALQFVFLMIDLLTVIGFILLHAFPHRIYRVYTTMCQGPSRRQVQAIIDNVNDSMEHISNFTEAVDEYVSQADNCARSALAREMQEGRRNKGKNNSRYYNDSWHEFNALVPRVNMDSEVLSYFSTLFDAEQKFAELVLTNPNSSATKAAADAIGALARRAVASSEAIVRVFKLKHGSWCVRDIRHLSTDRNSRVKKPKREKKKSKKESSNTHDPATLSDLSHDDDDDDHDHDNKNDNNPPTPPTTSLAPERQPMMAIAAGAARGADSHSSTIDIKSTAHIEQLLHRESAVAQDDALHALEDAIGLANKEYSATAVCDSGNDGWDGVITAVAEEVKSVLFDFAAVVCFFLVCATGYRLPWMLMRVYESRHKRMACILGVKELAIDVLYMFMFVLVLVSVRGTIKVLTDFISFLPRYPRFIVARAIISYHFALAVNAMFFIATIFFSCRAIKFTLATTAFAAFSPGVMLESAIAKLESTSNDSSNKFVAGMMLIFASFWMWGIPFISASQGTVDYTPKPASIYFGFMAGMVLLAIVMSLVHGNAKVWTLRRPVVRFARPTVQNVLAFVYLALEAVQLLALAFSALISTGMLVQNNGDYTVRKMSHYVFLLFGESWAGNGSMAFGAYFSVTVMALHFLFVAMPIVTNYILDWDDGAKINKSPVWIAIVGLIGFTMQLTVSRNIAELLSCEHGRSTYNSISGGGPTWVPPAPAPGVNTTTAPKCWEGPQRGMAVSAMILGVFYLPATLSRNAFFDESLFTGVDVIFTQEYRMLTGFATVTATVLVALLPHYGEAALGVLLAASLWCLLVSLFYEKLTSKFLDKDQFASMARRGGGGGGGGRGGAAHRRAARAMKELETALRKGDNNNDASGAAGENNGNPDDQSFCTFPALRTARTCVYLGSALSAIYCLIQAKHGSDPTNLWPVWASAATMAALFVFAIVFSIVRQCMHHPEDDTLDAVRADLLKLETELFSEEKMNLRWAAQRDAWARSVRSAVRISAMALAVMKLQENMSLLKISTVFLHHMPRWLTEIKAIVDEVDLEDDIEHVISNLSSRDRRFCFGDFEQDCDFCCEGGRSRRRWNRGDDDEDDPMMALMNYGRDIRTLEQVTQSLANASRGVDDAGGFDDLAADENHEADAAPTANNNHDDEEEDKVEVIDQQATYRDVDEENRDRYERDLARAIALSAQELEASEKEKAQQQKSNNNNNNNNNNKNDDDHDDDGAKSATSSSSHPPSHHGKKLKDNKRNKKNRHRGHENDDEDKGGDDEATTRITVGPSSETTANEPDATGTSLDENGRENSI